MKAISKLRLALAAAVLTAALASCSTMLGGGAVKVSLSGAEEVPPVTVPGKGSGSFRIDEDGTISGSVTTTDVQGTMAHIHRGAKGSNGPVIVPLDKSGDTYTVPAGRKLTPEQLKDLKAGNLYVNVHTNRYKGGEVRGQIQP